MSTDIRRSGTKGPIGTDLGTPAQAYKYRQFATRKDHKGRKTLTQCRKQKTDLNRSQAEFARRPAVAERGRKTAYLSVLWKSIWARGSLSVRCNPRRCRCDSDRIMC